MFFSRKEWGARPPTARYRLNPLEVRGVALHWPGDSIRRHTPDEVKRALRAWQADHMDRRGWSDIAYQEAIDQDGNRYQCRGLRHRSAANGDEDVNRTHGAILLVLAIGEKPSPAMVKEVKARVGRFGHIFGAIDVVGHRDIRPGPTACPGDQVAALIEAGAFG